MTTVSPGPPPLHALKLTELQDRCTVVWHSEPAEVPALLTGLERTVAEQHLANFALWHAEDEARTPGASDQSVARVKRFIDRTNQQRNDFSEQCDLLLLELLVQHNLPDPHAELNSESPGLILDRLSILSLKLFHTREEMERIDAPGGHRERNEQRLQVLTEQRGDLAHALDRLWEQVLQRQRQFKLYRQLKMYNDPALNPAVYSARAKPAP